MINSIRLKNFQSHQDSKLEFVPGINTVIGSSDSGKTSILRALYWSVYNRPSGDAFISHWARDKKGNQKEETSVTIIKGESILIRSRSADFNRYEIDGKKLDAIRMNVPEEVLTFFNLNNVNIQKQLDSPFLLDNSSGEVARFFNKVIKLEEIDQIMSLADNWKRKNKANIEQNELKQKENDTNLKGLGWIEDALNQIEKATILFTKIDTIKTLINKQKEQLNQYNNYKNLLKTIPDIEKADELIEELSLMSADYTNLQAKKVKIALSLSEKQALTGQISKSQTLLSLENHIDRALKLADKIKDFKNQLSKQADSIKNYIEITNKLSIITKEIPKLEALYPEICPTCGKPWKDDKCV